MTENEILEKLSLIVRRQVFNDSLKLNRDIKLKYDLGLDSLQTVNLIIEIEEELDIVFDDSDLDPEGLKTIGNLLNLINRTLNKDK